MTDQLRWRTSTFSQPNNDCIEVAYGAKDSAVRDTKNRSGGKLNLTPQSFTALVTAAKQEMPFLRI
jgi:hypothetical protein